MPVSHRQPLSIALLALLLALLCVPLAAQNDPAAPHKKKRAANGTKSATTHHSAAGAHNSAAHKKRASAHHGPRKKVTTARAQRMKKTFVASSDLRPMASQLVQYRTPAAYAGVENYARIHAGTEAASLAWFAIGYAHYLDAQYPQAITALTNAQPHIGELKDYTSFFIGNSYVLSNNPQASFTYLRDFGTRFPDSLYEHDANIAYAKALLAANRPLDAIHLLEATRQPAHADTEYYLGKAYVQNGQSRQGAEILRNVYYEYPNSSVADNAAADLKKIPDAAFLPPVTYAEHQRRADALYKSRHYGEAADEYRLMVDMAPPSEQPMALIQVANSLIHDGQNRQARPYLDRIPDNGTEGSAEKWYQKAEIARGDSDDLALDNILQHMRTATPKSPWLESALLTTGNMYLLRKNYDRAIDYYREMHERFPGGSKGSYAHWKYAWLTYRQNRKEEARKAFEDQIVYYAGGNETPDAMYWRARMAEDERDYGVARAYYLKLSERYRNFYYGVLARRRLATMPAATVATVAVLQHVSPAAAVSPTAQIIDPPEDDLHYNRAKLLENAGVTDLAVRELRPAVPSVRPGRCWRSRGFIPAAVSIIAR